LSDVKLSRGRLIASTVGIVLALLLAALDNTIVGTAMPRIVGELKGLDYYAWVTTAYLVTSTVMVPIAGKLGDLFGRKPFLLTGMIGFILASALCGLSQDMFQLIAFRGIQGIFGGVLFATVFTVLADLFAPAQRARMQGLFGGVFGLASIAGPVVGGFLTDNWGWRWVFYVNLPVGIAGTLVILAALPYVRSKASWRDIDFWGAITLAAGLVPLLIGFSITRDHAWTSPEVLGLLAFGAAMLVAFFLIEQRVKEPIVPFGLFKNRIFAVSMLVGFLTAFGMFGMIIFIPLQFQGVLGVSITNSGLLVTPMMLGLIAGSVVTGQLMTRIKYYRYIGTTGVLVMMAGMWLLAQITVGSNQFEGTRDLAIIGFGLGLTFPLYINAVQSALPQRYLGVGTSQIQFWRNVGGTVSTAILGSLLTHRLHGYVDQRIAALNLPPPLRDAISGFQSPQSLFSPAVLSALHAKLPPALYDQVLVAFRTALAQGLRDVILLSLAITVLALVATLFMKEVPLKNLREPEEKASEPVPMPAPAP
jgi:EmrB/QacA subfamily drug resistance transporter